MTVRLFAQLLGAALISIRTRDDEQTERRGYGMPAKQREGGTLTPSFPANRAPALGANCKARLARYARASVRTPGQATKVL